MKKKRLKITIIEKNLENIYSSAFEYFHIIIYAIKERCSLLKFQAVTLDPKNMWAHLYESENEICVSHIIAFLVSTRRTYSLCSTEFIKKEWDSNQVLCAYFLFSFGAVVLSMQTNPSPTYFFAKKETKRPLHSCAHTTCILIRRANLQL